MIQSEFAALPADERWNLFQNVQVARDDALSLADQRAAALAAAAEDKTNALTAAAIDKEAALRLAADGKVAELAAAEDGKQSALTAAAQDKADALATQQSEFQSTIDILRSEKEALAAQLTGGTTPTQITVPAVALVALQLEAAERELTVQEVFAEHASVLIRTIAESKQTEMFTRAMQVFPTRPPLDQLAVLTILGLDGFAGLPVGDVIRVMVALALPAYLALDRADQTAVMQHLGLA